MTHQNVCNPLEFFCALISPCTSQHEVMQLRRIAASGGVDWAAVAGHANHAGLAPALYVSLENTGISVDAPELLRNYLQEIYRFNINRNEAILEQLQEVVRLLNSAGVTPMLLKGGAALVSDCYPDPGMRFMWDIDLMVPVDLVDLSAAALQNAGYEVPLKYRSMITETSRHHYPILILPGKPAGVELHRRVIKDGGELLEPDSVWRDARPYSGRHLDGGAAVMSPTDEIIYCFAHSELNNTRHHRHEQIDLRHLHQFVCLIHHYRDDVDWRRIEALTHHPRFGRYFVRYLCLAEQLFRVPLPLSTDLYPDTERYCRMLTTPLNSPGRLCRLLRAVVRDLIWTFSKEQLQELYRRKDISVTRLRFRHFRVLFGRYLRLEAWKVRFGGLNR